MAPAHLYVSRVAVYPALLNESSYDNQHGAILIFHSVTLNFFGVYEVFGITAPAQMLY